MVIVEKLGMGKAISQVFYGKSLVSQIPGIATYNAKNIGELYYRFPYVQGTKVAGAGLEFCRVTDDPKLGSMDVVIPDVHIEYPFSPERWAELGNVSGALDVMREKLLEALAIKFDMLVLQGPNTSGEDIGLLGKMYGFIDTSNTTGGSRLLASTCDGGSTAGDWNTAGNPQKDLPEIAGAIRSVFPDAGALALIYPGSASQLFTAELVSGTGVYTGKTIEEYAQGIFKGGVFPANNDPNTGYCVLTGTACAHSDASAQVAGFAPKYWAFVQSQDVQLDEWYDQTENKFYMRGSVKKNFVPIVTNVGTTYYKAMSEIASIDLHD